MTNEPLKATHTPLPCPFCGSGPARSQGRGPGQASFSGVEMMADLAGCYRVWCGTCGAEGSPEATEAEAMTAWNTRAPSHHDLIEALRAMIEVAHGYAEYISSVPSAELERHPYLPGLEGQINESRAILTKAEAGR